MSRRRCFARFWKAQDEAILMDVFSMWCITEGHGQRCMGTSGQGPLFLLSVPLSEPSVRFIIGVFVFRIFALLSLYAARIPIPCYFYLRRLTAQSVRRVLNYVVVFRRVLLLLLLLLLMIFLLILVFVRRGVIVAALKVLVKFWGIRTACGIGPNCTVRDIGNSAFVNRLISS